MTTIGMLCSHPVFTRAAHLTIRSRADDARTHGSAHMQENLYIAEMKRIFELYPDVRSLVMEGTTACYYIGNVLIPEGRAPPKLTILRLRDVRFYSRPFFDMNFISTPHLLHTLRRLRKRKLKRLELEQCTLEEVDVQKLREGLGEGRVSLVDCVIEG